MMVFVFCESNVVMHNVYEKVSVCLSHKNDSGDVRFVSDVA